MQVASAVQRPPPHAGEPGPGALHRPLSRVGTRDTPGSLTPKRPRAERADLGRHPFPTVSLGFGQRGGPDGEVPGETGRGRRSLRAARPSPARRQPRRPGP